MKKLFTVDDFLVAFISALGYGLSFEIHKILGWEMWQCVIFCMIVGGALDAAAKKIIFNEIVQNNRDTKNLIFFAFIVLFIVGQYVALKLTGLSMHNYLLEQYQYIILPAILGFAYSMILRWYQVRKIRQRYGDGSKGFLYDELTTPENLAEFNKQNQPIKGEYDTELAVKTKTGIFVGEKEKKL